VNVRLPGRPALPPFGRLGRKPTFTLGRARNLSSLRRHGRPDLSLALGLAPGRKSFLVLFFKKELLTPLMDPWLRFRAATRARIGLGRAGDALPTAALLDFTLAHARARDAVHGAPDFAAIAARLRPDEALIVQSQAADRVTYLRRPDLGRRLSGADRGRLTHGAWDAVFVVADGLSATAIDAHAVPMIEAARARLQGWRQHRRRQARVALGDEIGAAVGARFTVLLVGERPGLTVQDSLGIYLTFAPGLGRTDAQRNCLSNIHADGQSYDAAAEKLAWLMRQALRLGLTGVGLKEDAPVLLAGPRDAPALSAG
jgi:ethanolamine ammonia-lyase small subunit